MSRRKQAKPRSLKREDEDVPSSDHPPLENKTTDMPSTMDDTPDSQGGEGDDTPGRQMTSSDHVPQPSGSKSPSCEASQMVTMTTDDYSPNNYTCETCCMTLNSLQEFMDHKNYICNSDAGDDCKSTSSSPSPSQASSPQSVEAGKSPSNPLDISPYSPSIDQLPYTVGVTETTPYQCQFCEKAFIRLSHLKKHEQVHSDQMPFKCDYCQRFFKHKRSRDRHIKLHTGDKKYKCTHCNSAFSRSDHLKIHLKTHDNAKPYQCVECNRGYTTPAALTSHMITHIKSGDKNSENTQELSCNFCAETFVSDFDLQEHIKEHEDNLESMLKCSFCSEQFTSQQSLENHVDSSHGNQSQYKCPFCKERFQETEELFSHMKSHDTSFLHSKQSPSGVAKATTSQMSVFPSQSTKPTKDKQPKLSYYDPSEGRCDKACPYCTKKYPSLEVLEIHIHTMHEGKPTMIYNCHYCGLVFPSAYLLNEHVKITHDGRTTPVFPCEFCTMDFASSDALEYHINNVHKYNMVANSNSEQAFCSQCNISFQSSSALSEHVQKVHSKDRNSSLSNIGNHGNSVEIGSQGNESNHSNNNYSNLRSALRIPDVSKLGSISKKTKFKTEMEVSPIIIPESHAEEHNISPIMKNMETTSALNDEGLACEHCNALFTDPDLYHSHVKSHLDEPCLYLPCQQCGAAFKSEEQLESHTLAHFLCLTTEFGCTSCLKLFSKPDELQKHLMDIHAHHLYRCSLCKETFDSKVNVQVHFAIKHSNECKLYQCTACSTVFRSEMEWQLHVKVNHLHITKPYRCLFCKESFSAEIDLQCHLTTHKKSFVCPQCNEAFHVEFLLDKHIHEKHADDLQVPVVEEKPPPPPPLTPIKTKEDVEVIDLSKTAKVFSPTESLSHVPGAGQAQAKQRNVYYHKMREIFQCELCDAKFSNDLSFQNHYKYKHSIKAPMEKYKAVIEKQQSSQKLPQINLQALSDRYAHKCVYCNQTFKMKSELEKHMKSHGNPTYHKCKVCDEVFPSVNVLAEHKLSHCKVGLGNNCAVCRLVIKNEEHFYSHTQSHGGKTGNTQCIICRQTLTSVVELQMHAKHHFKNKLPSFTCCVCLSSFGSKTDLVTKVNSSGREYYVCKTCYHGNDQSETPKPTHYTCRSCLKIFSAQTELVSKLNSNGKEYHICKMCYHGNSNLDSPKTAPQFFTCCACLKTFETKENLVSRLNSSNREYFVCKHCYYGDQPNSNIKKTEYRCPECSVKFESKDLLDAHLPSHTKTYQCIKCQQSFGSEYEIQMHVATHMFQEGVIHDCHLCGEHYDSPAKLQAHLIEHSFNSSSFICSVCDMVHDSATTLQSHVNQHDGMHRKYSCSQCNQRFFFSAELENHSYTHEHVVEEGAGQSEEKSNVQFQCPQCPKSFPNIVTLCTHMKVHDLQAQYPCSVCHLMFSSTSSLQQHVFSVHSSRSPELRKTKNHATVLNDSLKSLQSQNGTEKLHHCKLCGKTFSKKSRLKEHLKTHGGHQSQSTGHSCELCQETFSTAKYLRRHLIAIHNKTFDNICKLCNESFTLAKNLKRHMVRVHSAGKNGTALNFISNNESNSIPDSVRMSSSPDPDDILSTGSEEMANGVAMDTLDVDDVEQYKIISHHSGAVMTVNSV